MIIRDHLEDPVEGDHGPGPAHPGAAVDHDGPLLGTHAVAEGAHEPAQTTFIHRTAAALRRNVKCLFPKTILCPFQSSL